jgi:hypothetical protein
VGEGFDPATRGRQVRRRYHGRTEIEKASFVTLRAALLMAVASAALFACMAGTRLNAPGLYYDEVHQVPAVFAWLGRPQAHFALSTVGGRPWLTTPYGAAIKSALFAAFLRTTGSEFSVAAWRWFGIVMVVAGWLACAAAVGVRYGAAAELAFVVLLLTDTTVLLTTRHDWGPTALALALRCLLLAAALLSSSGGSALAAFALGWLVGLSIFEKLSSVVLLGPLAIMLLGRPRRAVVAALAGLAIACLPLAIVNVATWSSPDGPISLARLHDEYAKSVAQFGRDFLALGQGDWVRRWVLDLPVGRPFIWGELFLMMVLVALAYAEPRARRLAASYLVIGATLFLLPRRTQAHHWIIGTPFQYAAIAVLATVEPGRLRSVARVCLLALLLLRLPGVVATSRAIAGDRTAERFDPALTRVPQSLAARSDAFVVASTWGIANQIVAFAQGRVSAVDEPIYEDAEVEAFERHLAATESSQLYLVELPRQAHLFPSRTTRITAAVERDSRWREVDAEPELRGPSPVRVRKFVRRATDQ